MSAIREIVHGAPAPLHKATAKPEAYAEVGNRVEVEGHAQADNSVLAKKIKLED